ncbi:hypothetical protein C1H46_001345 [Malus baccata]|uniref:Uncharacterized protein n=1 Tax=Malus baccata TaxID=106549 RepID=A0A540NQY4_MALBA|nr:hypothetical protein C1H46_001345 [Malus baccata]
MQVKCWSRTAQLQKPPSNPSKTQQPFHFSHPKTLISPNWVSFNFFKIATFSLLTLTIATLFFLYNSNDSPSTFLCFKSHLHVPKPLQYPTLTFDSIRPISDKSSGYASFSSDRWIVVSVSDYPSESLRKLVRVKGWQVLAIGNSRTPVDWSLKGVIYLSMDDQAKLEFRVWTTFLMTPSYAMVSLLSLPTSTHIHGYLPKIYNRFTSAEGFLFLQDNTVLNYWNLLQADKTKLWITNKVPQSWITSSVNGKDLEWLSKQANMVKKVVSAMPVHLQVNYKESMPREQSLVMCSAEVFYIPQQFVGDFVDLVGLVGNFEIHNKVAVPMFFMAMDSPNNYESVLNTMIYKPEASSSNSSSIYSAHKIHGDG